MADSTYVIYPVPGLHYLEIIYEDPIHLKNTYRFIHEWLVENSFVDDFGADHFIEKLYLDYRGLAPTGVGECMVLWRTSKVPPNWGSNYTYYKYFLNVNFHMINIVDVKVPVPEWGGKQRTVQQGELNINLKPWIKLDIGGVWKKNSILSMFQEHFLRRIYEKEMTYHKNELFSDTYKLQTAIKEFFQRKQFVTPPEAFHHRYETL